MKFFLKLMYSTAIAVIIAAIAACSSNKEHDRYLKSLGVKTEILSYADSFNIEQYDMFQVSTAVKMGDDWLILSSSKGDYNLLFVNLAGPEHFFALRRGRGPGEMIQGGSLHKYGEAAFYYDVNNATCIRIDCAETINRQSLVADTVGIFNQGSSRPVYMTSCGPYVFISGNMSDLSTWYSCYDAIGRILSSVPSINCAGMSGMDERRLSSLMLSSKYVSNPDGTKVCVANVPTASLSFSVVHSGKLTEYKRYEYDVSGTGDYFGPDAISAFHGIDSDDENVYVIYSGHKMKNDVLPPNECRHLIVYDWDGNPAKHYLLNRNVSSVHVDGDNMWCASTYPESCVYRFEIPRN